MKSNNGREKVFFLPDGGPAVPGLAAVSGQGVEMLAECEIAGPLRQVRGLMYRVTEVVDPTSQIRIVRLGPPSGGTFRFAAGQYAMLSFGEHRARPFSLAGRPEDRVLEFHMRHGGGDHAATRLRPGDGVGVEGPFGEAYLREQHAGSILGIAGGTGLAPLLSIVATALARDADRDIRLYVGARDEGDLYVAPRLHALAERHRRFRWIPVLSATGALTGLRTGMVTEALAEDLASGAIGRIAGSKAYFAGPRPMVATAAALLRGAGIKEGDIHADGLASVQ